MKRKTSNGTSLIFVIAVMAIISILGISIMAVSLANTRQTVVYEKNTRANFLARSGVEMGLNLIDENIGDLISVNSYSEIGNRVVSFVYDLNSMVGNGVRHYNSEGSGYFTIKFENSGIDFIKVTSTGYIGDSETLSSTLMSTLFLNFNEQLINPDGWVLKGNQKRTFAINPYIGKKVVMTGQLSNEPGSEMQLYPASAICYSDTRICLRIIRNNVSKVNDSPVHYFNGQVVIDKPHEDGESKGTLYLDFSNDVAGGTYKSGCHGFEDFNYYKRFVKMYLGKNRYTDLALKKYYDLYKSSFSTEPIRYGIVCFKKPLTINGYTMEKGYYFFPQNLDLDNGNYSVYYGNKYFKNPKLIKIKKNPNGDATLDPVIEAVEVLISKPFYFEPGLNEWSEK